jgi:hypothetical protein
MTTTATYMTDFIAAVEKLDAADKNWVIFQCHFIIAFKQKKVIGHFNYESLCLHKTRS